MAMKINTYAGGPKAADEKKIQSGAAQQAERADGARKSTAASKPGGDTVTISDEGMQRAEAIRVASMAPDVRADRVSQLKAAVANGDYEPNPQTIAKALLRDELRLVV
jgi:flagellar biosynthesis anti-sigma factor FlgM